MVNHRPLVGAHYGLKDWLAQRVTALVMAAYLIIFLFALLAAPSVNHEFWRALFAGSLMRCLTFLFIVSLAWHAWVGIRDIWMDYVKPVSVRLTLHVLTLLMLIGCAGWAVQILWRL